MDVQTFAKAACRLLALYLLALLITSTPNSLIVLFLPSYLPGGPEWQEFALVSGIAIFVDLLIRSSVIAALWFGADRLAARVVPEQGA